MDATVLCPPSPEEFKLDLGLSGEQEEAELSDDEEEKSTDANKDAGYDSDDDQDAFKQKTKKRR